MSNLPYPLNRPKSPGGVVAHPHNSIVLIGADECILAKRDGDLKCVRGSHNHLGGGK